MKREALRYLGCRGNEADEKTKDLIESVFRELEEQAEFRLVSQKYSIIRAGVELRIGAIHTDSRNLKGNLEGCEKALVLAATLGVGIDRLMRRYAASDISRAAVLQACSAALLEEKLDLWQEGLAQDYRKEGKYFRPRFSPGYGDFAITAQGIILQMLDAGKRIGLGMTDSCMLTPTKSVTAVIGITDEKTECEENECSSCQKTDCAFRRI